MYLFHPQTHQVLDLLSKFENGVGRQMDLTQKYLVVLQRYECDLEFVRKLYQREKNNPSSAQFKTHVSPLLSDNQTAQLYFIFKSFHKECKYALNLFYSYSENPTQENTGTTVTIYYWD